MRAVTLARLAEEKTNVRYRIAALAIMAAALPPSVQAQPVSGLYIGGGGGVNIMQNESDASVNGVAAAPGKGLQMDVGATAVGSVGWGFGNGLRTEVEFDYRTNGLDKSINPGLPDGTLHGAEQKYGPMVNVLYDFGISPAFVPYVGAGVGYQWVNVDATSFHTATGTAGAFAYQGILGAAIPIATVPGLAVTGEYRFMGLAGDRSYSSNGVTVDRTDDYNHSVMVGLRYAFGAPPPVAVMAAPTPVVIPAPAPARSYLVFFDWNKATLSARARQIIKGAADNAMKVQYTRIEVNGYTDTSGTPQYNQGLSIRRADAVAGELVRDGVPKDEIAIQGFGETRLLVPTGPGVREPQNRRVEIIIH